MELNMPIENPIFSKSFIDSLPDDNDEALIQICTVYKTFVKGMPDPIKAKDHYENILRAHSFLKVFLRTKGLRQQLNFNIGDTPIIDVRDIENDFNRISSNTKSRLSLRKRQNLLDKFDEENVSLIGDGLKIEIPESNLKEIQALINQLRDEIQKSHVLPEGHRVRLLRRLEKFQSELHKTMSNLDTFWSFFGDAGAVLGKFGKEVKPLVDQIREIAKIITNCLVASQGLPQGTILFLPGIPTDNDNNEGEKQKK